MGALSSILLVGAYAVFPVLWIFLRFAWIIYTRWRIIYADMKGRFAMVIHTLLGLIMVGAAPLLAHLCAASPTDENETTIIAGPYRPLLIVFSVFLMSVNLGGFLLLPNPNRCKNYKVTRRSFVAAIAPTYVSALQFTSMSLMPLAFLLPPVLGPVLPALITAVGAVLYLLSVLICFWELCLVPWEDQALIKFFLAKLPRGLKRKSHLVSNALNDPDLTRAALPFVLGLGIPAFFQAAAIFWSFVRGPATCAPHKGLQDFFVVLALYNTIVMSGGFFLFTQLDPKSESYTRMVVADLVLGQLLPLLAILNGPEWAGGVSIGEFWYQYTLWSSC